MGHLSQVVMPSRVPECKEDALKGIKERERGAPSGELERKKEQWGAWDVDV